MSEHFFYFIQQLVNGMTLGSTYALIAIGYTMVYGIIGMINFAHGEIYMVGTYIAFVVLSALMMAGFDNVPLLFIGAFAISMLVTSVYGWSIERIAYRPLRGGNRLIPLISAIGMSIFLQNLVRTAQGSRDVALPTLVSGGWVIGPDQGFHLTISYMQVVIFAVTFLAMTVLSAYISRSRMGQACRACSEDLGMAALLGIDTNKVIAFTFIVGAALASVAGVLLGVYYGVVNPYVGFIAGIKAFTAAVLGGIGSIPGAVLGGMLLGITEALTAGYLSPEYSDVVSFLLLCFVLLFMPTGILGRPEVEKV
ncbi:high-affinity branched-chain amino acid ABC transporter permease LivH [Celerinatantimonas sp. MCCC 1A17872]|uniref:high-affinity branched-chain amino acid ABC transporter permease LivH n=1 Tax=Celerinatantimonas sp. MCCC 1A17872 TaxID=3177514 RepID=UPI0038C85FB4